MPSETAQADLFSHSQVKLTSHKFFPHHDNFERGATLQPCRVTPAAPTIAALRLARNNRPQWQDAAGAKVRTVVALRDATGPELPFIPAAENARSQPVAVARDRCDRLPLPARTGPLT